MYSSRGATFKGGGASGSAGGGASSISSIPASRSTTSTMAPARSMTVRYFSAPAASRLFLITTRRPENNSAMRCSSAWNSRARLLLTVSSGMSGTV
ncbi:hypothetical protein D9M71_720810 [compost metagenome]